MSWQSEWMMRGPIGYTVDWAKRIRFCLGSRPVGLPASVLARRRGTSRGPARRRYRTPRACALPGSPGLKHADRRGSRPQARRRGGGPLIAVEAVASGRMIDAPPGWRRGWKARYLLNLFAATLTSQDPRRQKLTRFSQPKPLLRCNAACRAVLGARWHDGGFIFRRQTPRGGTGDSDLWRDGITGAFSFCVVWSRRSQGYAEEYHRQT
jgi:hypothetical protein